MAIVAHVSDVTHGPLVFMNILLMLGFVVHLYPGRHLILFPLFQIVTGMIYRFSKHNTKYKNILLKRHQNKENVLKYLIISKIKKMTTISFSLRVNKQLFGDTYSYKFEHVECNAILH